MAANSIVKIGLKGLAMFMTSSSTRQRSILRNYKYPDPEGFAQATYYREARDYIETYHHVEQQPSWLLERAKILDSFAAQSIRQTKARYQNNARVLRAYARHFGKKDFEIMPSVNLRLNFSGVSITVVPDLHVREKDTEKIIKLEFTKEEPDDRLIKIISQAMFEAQSVAGLGLKSASVLYFDVTRGRVHKGARAGARMRKEIEAACENLAAIWGTL